MKDRPSSSSSSSSSSRAGRTAAAALLDPWFGFLWLLSLLLLQVVVAHNNHAGFLYNPLLLRHCSTSRRVVDRGINTRTFHILTNLSASTGGDGRRHDMDEEEEDDDIMTRRPYPNNNRNDNNNDEMNSSPSQHSRRQESLEHGHDPLLSLNLNLDALARAKAPERAQELYQRISALYEEGYYAVPPDIVSFNSVLKAWQDNPQKALEFWESEAAIPGRSMNVRSYNTFLLALARNGLYEPAEHLLRQMEQINAAVRPDRISWNTVLLAYANAAAEEEDGGGGDPAEAAPRADALLQEMIQRSSAKRGVGGEPKKKKSVDDDDDAKEGGRRDAPLQYDNNVVPPPPDATSFNTVMSAWVAHPNQKEGVMRVERLFRDMHEIVPPDVYTYSTILKALRNAAGIRSLSLSSSERALELLNEMKENHLHPNRVVYTTIVQILCNNQQVHRAQKLVQKEMLDDYDFSPIARPDCATFTALMDGWADYAKTRQVQDNTDRRRNDSNSADDEAVRAVFQLLRQMKELSVDYPEMAPNRRTYTSLLKTIAASRHPDGAALAKSVMSDMVDFASPTTIHFNAALDCCAKAPRATKAVDALRLWQTMKHENVDCDAITYNTILNAAANAFGSAHVRQESLRVGLQAFRESQKNPSCEPTSVTYCCYFKMLRRLMSAARDSAERDALVEEAFDLCCRQGCLNEMVLQQVATLLSKEQKQSLFGGNNENNNGKVKISSLPTDWSRRALGRRRGR